MGKRVPYKGSELLAVDVLERLCGLVVDDVRSMMGVKPGRWWDQRSSLQNETVVHMRKKERTSLGRICEDVIADHEEWLTEEIRASHTGDSSFSKELCYDRTKLCKKKYKRKSNIKSEL